MKIEKDQQSPAPSPFSTHGGINPHHHSAPAHAEHAPQPTWAVHDHPSPHDAKTPGSTAGSTGSPHPFPHHHAHYSTPPSHLPRPHSHAQDHIQPALGPYSRPPPLAAGGPVGAPGPTASIIPFTNGHHMPPQILPPAPGSSEILPPMRDAGAFPHIDSYRPRKLSGISISSDNTTRLNPVSAPQQFPPAYGLPGNPQNASHGSLPRDSTPHPGNGAVPDNQKCADSPAPDFGGNGVPEKQRLRVNRACDRCRMHKIKCSGSNPCTNCLKHAVDCMFRGATEEQPAKRARTGAFVHEFEAPAQPEPENYDLAAEKPKEFSQPMSKDTYITFLENRVKYLENTVLREACSPPSGTLTEKSNFLEPEFYDYLKPVNTKWRFCRRYQSALVVRLCSSLYDELSPERKAQVVVPRVNYYGWNMSGCKYLKPERFPFPPDMSSISIEQRKEYVDYFFAAINPLYGILHETVFREQLEVFQKDQFDKPKTDSTALFSAMITMVYAICIRFTEFQKPAGPSMAMLGLEEALFKYSHKVVQIFSSEWESFELIQCWLLTTLYLRVAHRQTSCNSSLSHAISMCRSMGIGRYGRTFLERKPYEFLKAKRILQSAYIFDRCMGVQGGHYHGFNDQEIHFALPALEDVEEETKKDDWISPSSIAMLHVARLVNYINLRSAGDSEVVASKRVSEEVQRLDSWLDQNGFNDDTDLFTGADSPEASLVKAQVKFHFYDLMQCIYGKKLFRYVGFHTNMDNSDDDIILRTNQRAVRLLEKVDCAGLLYTPWYLNLGSLVTAGVNSSVFLKVGAHTGESKALLRNIMALLHKFQDSQVRDERGRVVFRQRFKMAEEVVWLFKVVNHLMALSFEESIRSLQDLGTDHGSAEVNRRLFRQIGMYGRNSEGDLDKLMEDQNSRVLQSVKDERDTPEAATVQSASSADEPMSQPRSSSGNDQFLDNLAWFNQWVDFPHDI